MSLIIYNISSSSVRVNFNYLESERIFGYDVVADYSIDVSDVQFDEGSGVLLEGREALKAAVQKQNLVARIGTDEFINGRITSLSFESSAMVGGVSAKFTIEESKKLDSYANNVFAQNIPSPHFLSSFVESYDFSRSEDSYSYTRNVSIQYKQQAGNQFLNHAREFLNYFYNSNRPNYGYNTDGISEDARIDDKFKPLITETYDLINLSVAMTENFESSKIFGNYSKRQTYSYGVSEEGFADKRYSIEIKALREPLEKVAEDACRDVLDALVASNNGQFGKPVTIEKGIAKDGGSITLSIGFTNDPKRQTQTVVYTASKTKRGAYFDYSISANFSSEGKTVKEKYDGAKQFWSDFQPRYEEILNWLFDCGLIYEKSRSTNFEKQDYKVSESLEFTNDPSYAGGLPDGIIKRRISRNTKPQHLRTSKFVDLKDLREKLLVSDLNTIGEGDLTVEVVPFRSRGLFFGQEYLEGLNLIESGQYTASDQVNIDSANGTTSRVISYVFTS